MTPDEVAELLQVSSKTVYKHAKSLGGFYLPGIKTLRFSKEALYDNLERQIREMAIQDSNQSEEVLRKRISNKKGSFKSTGTMQRRSAMQNTEYQSRHGVC